MAWRKESFVALISHLSQNMKRRAFQLFFFFQTLSPWPEYFSWQISNFLPFLLTTFSFCTDLQIKKKMGTDHKYFSVWDEPLVGICQRILWIYYKTMLMALVALCLFFLAQPDTSERGIGTNNVKTFPRH